ncbi:hypothetical protein [Thioalkalivibrio sp. ALE19]|uniref:hypothetical protein n=1 Tax=Thioalkalivibrio sp. ALE19 TaxID=1266909 RepID=UPI000412DCB6|nr:hypothetical protein [Thioalkalivibrio sp. ALE19]
MTLRFHDPRDYLGRPVQRRESSDSVPVGGSVHLYSDGSVAPDFSRVSAALVVVDGHHRRSFWRVEGPEAFPGGRQLSSLEAELLGLWMATEYAVWAGRPVTMHGDHLALVSSLAASVGIRGANPARPASIPGRIRQSIYLQRALSNLRLMAGRIRLLHGNDRHYLDIRAAHHLARHAIKGKAEGAFFDPSQSDFAGTYAPPGASGPPSKGGSQKGGKTAQGNKKSQGQPSKSGASGSPAKKKSQANSSSGQKAQPAASSASPKSSAPKPSKSSKGSGKKKANPKQSGASSSRSNANTQSKPKSSPATKSSKSKPRNTRSKQSVPKEQAVCS